MQRFSHILLGLAFLLSAATQVLAAGEEILSFNSEITIHEDATVTIVETIMVRATGDRIKRGIYRDFPTDYKDRYGNTVRVSFEVLKTMRDAEPVNHWIESISGGKRVYMGSKDAFIPPGDYVFQLIYRTDRQIGYYDGFDELAWNVTGDGWVFPILKASADIHLPPGATVLEKVAYTGTYGSTEQAATVQTNSPDQASFRTTRTLYPGEGLTVAVSWPKGFVREPTQVEGVRLLLQDNAGLLAGVVGLIVVLGYYLTAWAYVGRDPKPGTIIPLFRPPEGMSPAVVRYLVKTKVDDETFCAAIVSLAVKGVVRIFDDDGEYTLHKVSSNYTSLSEGERGVAKELFADGRQSVVLKNSNHATVSGARSALADRLESEVDDVYILKNRTYWIVGIVLSVLAAAVTLYFYGAVTFGNLDFVVSLVPMLIFPAFLFRVLMLFGTSAKSLLNKKVYGLLVKIVAPLAVLAVFNLVGAYSVIAWAPVVFVGLLAIIPMVFSYLLRAPTIRGRTVLDRIQGFKLYLSVAEKHQLEAMHPPEETPETFERYMPYAIALDVGHIWSQRFANHLQAVSDAGSEGGSGVVTYRPRWFSGRSWSPSSMSSLGQNLGTSLSGAIGSAGIAPASSSRGSFTSGGGGSSGGGGGGGGGGGF